MVAQVHGEFLKQKSPRTPHAGTYAAWLTARLTDSAANEEYPATLFAEGALVDGEFTIAVPPSDSAAILPQGVPVDILVSLSTGKMVRYSVTVPDGTTVELADVVLPQELPDTDDILIRGVPNGIAELDSTGKVPLAQLPALGAAALVHTQSSALASWSISHTFARLPLVSVYVGGAEVIADVDATATNVTVTFPSPTSGVAVLA